MQKRGQDIWRLIGGGKIGNQNTGEQKNGTKSSQELVFGPTKMWKKVKQLLEIGTGATLWAVKVFESQETSAMKLALHAVIV